MSSHTYLCPALAPVLTPRVEHPTQPAAAARMLSALYHNTADVVVHLRKL
jgi:hypothetical protein